MARTLSVYLTTDEAKELDRLCEELNVTPYRALRLALQLLFKESRDREKPQPKETPQTQEKPQPNGLLRRLAQESEHERSEP